MKNRLSLRPRLIPWSFLPVVALCITTRVSGQFAAVTLPTGLQPTESEMVVYQNNLCLVLQNADHNTFSLHKTNGGSFMNIPLPTGYKLYQDTQFEELKNNLYFMPDRSTSTGTAELLRYDGTTVTPIDIPDALVPRETMSFAGHTPFTYNDVLYIEATLLDSLREDALPVTYWIKYDGTTFSRMMVTPRYTCVEFGPDKVSDKKLFQGKMFMRYHDFAPGSSRELTSYDGSSVQSFTEHPNFIAKPGGCDMEVYNGNLYIPTRPDITLSGSTDGLNRYDGTTQTAVTMPAGLRYVKTTLEVYAGKLWGAMNDGSVFPQWYAYDGTTFTRTTLPTGTRIHPGGDQRVFQCKLYIVLSTGPIIGTPVHALFTYSDVHECGLIPPVVDRLERFDIRNYRREREWCWTGVDVNWTLPTPCTPPCIDPLIRTALLDKPGQEIWAKTYDKPFQVTYPVDDKQSFIATTSIKTDKGFQDLVVLDKELVPAGIEELKLEMNPAQQKMQLAVSTEKDAKVPFVMALQDANGKTLWEQKFTAPITTAVSGTTSQRGTTLRFKLDGTAQQITSLSVYPNPAQGSTTIAIGTNGSKLPTRVTITDLFGKTFYKQDVTAPITINPDLSQAPKGMYVVSAIDAAGRQYTETLVVK